MGIWPDVRFAARLFVKSPGFTAVVVLVLAFGLGVNTAVFTFVNTILLRGLPYDEPDQLVVVGSIDARSRQGGVSWLDFQDYRAATKTFEGMSAAVFAPMNFSEEGRPADQYNGVYNSWNTFRLIRQSPLIGRDFSADDDRVEAEPVLILSHNVWQNRYGNDPEVIGRPVRVNGRAYTIIGVMPPGEQFPFNSEVWLPFNKLPPESLNARRNVRNPFVTGRLNDGVSIEQARAELSGLAAGLAATYADTNKDVRATVGSFNEQTSGPQIRLTLLALMGAVGFVLLIACANVANLLLARSGQRAHEIAIRLSMGATRWRIVRQLLIESVMLATAGGIVGLGIGVVGIRLFDRALSSPDLGKPYWMTFDLEPLVFGFLAAVAVGSGILFGLAPALHTTRTDTNTVLKEAGGRSGTSGSRARRWTSALIITEVALTLVLLAGAGFMMRSFLAMYRMDLGMQPGGLLTMNVFLPLTRYPQPPSRAQIIRQMDERLRGTPGVQNAAFMTSVPLFGGIQRRLSIAGRPDVPAEDRPAVTMVSVTPRYFETMGIHIIRGRGLGDADGRAGQTNAIVNQRLAAMYFADADPIGQQLTLHDPGGQAQVSAPRVVTIVGISPTIRQRNVDTLNPDPVVYLPYESDPQRSLFLVVRAGGDVSRLSSVLREEMRLVEPDLPLSNIRTMEQMLALRRWSYRIFGSMFALFAAIALVLSAVGLYAVTAFTVAQRIPEIAVRMALGAQPAQVLWLVMRRSLWQLLIGVPLGIAGAIGARQLLQSIVVKSEGSDLIILPAIVVLMAAVSLVACLVPARRAARLDPNVALR